MLIAGRAANYKHLFFLMFLVLYENSMKWGERAAFAAVALALAEFCWRFARFLSETFFYSKHYPCNKKLSTAFKYGFTFSTLSLYLLGIIVVVVSSYLSISTVYGGILEQSYLLPIWWIFRYTKFTASMYDCADWIRSDSGLDCATGISASYFHGFLNLILPKDGNEDGIIRRIEKYEDKHKVQFAIKRLFILIPNSLHTRPVIESPLMERQDGQPLEGVRRDRAGVSRPYISDVYSLFIDGSKYYITVEGAAPLLSYFDALNFDLTSTWQMKAMQKEIMIKFYRYLKKILQKCPGTQEQCELVFYNDFTSDGRRQDVGEILCVHIKQMWEKMSTGERLQ